MPYPPEIAGNTVTFPHVKRRQNVNKDILSIYQLKEGEKTQDYRFEPYDRLRSTELW